MEKENMQKQQGSKKQPKRQRQQQPEPSDFEVFQMLTCKTFEDGNGNVYSTYGHLMSGDGVTVWKAKKNDDKDEFALKQMESEDMALENTWENEAAIQRSIPEHDSILRLEAAFKIVGKGFYIVTPLCRAGTLEDETLSQPEHILPEDLSITLGLDILNGLIHLHGQGIVHNDIKPQNIFMRDRGQGALLGDFGQSKRHLAGEEMPKLPRPQTEYAAPEQQKTGRGSFPVDVWALGITLYEVVVGVRPNLDKEFRLLPGKKFLDRSKDFQEATKAMLISDAEARPSAKDLKTYAFFKTSEQQMPKDQGQGLQAIQEAQEGQEDLGNQESTLKHPRDETEGEETESYTSGEESLAGKRLRFKTKEDDIEYFSEPSDDDDDGEDSDEPREVPLDDHSEPSASLLLEDEHDQEEEHECCEEGTTEESSDDEDDDSETGSNSNSDATADGANGAQKLLFFGQFRGIHDVLIDYDKKRAEGQSGDVAVDVVLEQSEGKEKADVMEMYDSESEDSENDGVEWVEVP